MLKITCSVAEGVQVQVENAEGKRIMTLLVMANGEWGNVDVLPRSGYRCKSMAWEDGVKVLNREGKKNGGATIDVARVARNA